MFESNYTAMCTYVHTCVRLKVTIHKGYLVGILCNAVFDRQKIGQINLTKQI